MTIKFYFDLESIPDQRPDAFDQYLDAVEPPGNYKKQDSIDKWLAENAEAVALENYKKTGLNGLHGEICSIAWAMDNDDIQHLTRFHDVSEAELLQSFWDDVYRQVREAGGKSGNWPKLEWIGHNVIDFDLRFLKQRCIVNKIRPAFDIPADGRHGQGWVFDTMKEWGGWRGYVKQDELVEVFGIETPQWAIDAGATETDGSMVWDLYRKGDFNLISAYNQLDVYYVRELYKRMTFA